MTQPAIQLFCFYRDSPARKQSLIPGKSPSLRSYQLYGADRLDKEKWQARINLEKTPGTIAHHAGTWLSQLLHRIGGYGGDFPSCFSNLKQANRSDLIWSTVDTLGIPLSIMKSWRWVRPEILYTSIGLLERLAKMEDTALKKWHVKALNHCSGMMCYGWKEAEGLKALFDCPVHFIPYGVDTDIWVPLDVQKIVDILSLGMDPQRDFSQLLEYARANPERSVRIITNTEHRKAMTDIPPNVKVDLPVPLSDLPKEMAAARVIALTVKENTYSGATTTLLQSMSMGLPVVVSDVGAISKGYDFREHASCVPVPPGDPRALSEALEGLLNDPEACAALGKRARLHVEHTFNWNSFVMRIENVLGSIIENK